jgi:hypothetical protein
LAGQTSRQSEFIDANKDFNAARHSRNFNKKTTQRTPKMADYDSDSSGADDIETGVTLGYASKEATGDDFSQIGGHPV